MRNEIRRARFAVAAFAATALAPAFAAADEVFAVTTDDTLVRFDTATPGTVTSTKTIVGLTGHVIAVDVRPVNGELFALTDANFLFRIDPATGNAVKVGTGALVPAIVGTDVGMDFSPTADRLRVVTDLNHNLRIDASTGTIVDADAGTVGVQLDTDLAFAVGDANAGADPNVVGLAYADSAPTVTTTTAYGIDSNLDVLVRLGDMDVSETTRTAGTLHTIGSLGVNTTGVVGFDVSRTTPGVAYAVMTLNGETTSKLFRIDLTTGAATLIGTVGDARTVRAMAIGPVTPVTGGGPGSIGLIGLTQAGEIVKFSSTSSATIASRATVTGLQPGDSLVAIDTRTTNRTVYGLSNTGRLYTIDVNTGAATVVSATPLEIPLVGTSFGFDFDAATGRVRIVSDTGLSLRVDATTGAVIDADPLTAGVQADTQLAFAAGDVNLGQTVDVVAIAYDHNDAASATTLYGIDANRDVLVRIGSTGGSPESSSTGMVHTVGNLGFDTSNVVGFEIVNDSNAFAALNVGGTTSLYSVDLTTGAATLVGPVGTSETLIGLAAGPTTPSGTVFSITHVKMNLNLKRTGRDMVIVQGTLPFTAGQSLSGRTITIDVGGFSKTFVLNQLGKRRDKNGTRAASDDDTFQVIGRPKNGMLRFKAQFRRENLVAALIDEDLNGTATVHHVTRTVLVTVTIDGTSYAATVNLDYTARIGRNATIHSVGVATD